MLFVDSPPSGRPATRQILECSLRIRCWSSQLQHLLGFDAWLFADLGFLAFPPSVPSHPLLSLCSDLVRESFYPLPSALHMRFEFYYCNKSALCWLFSALCHGGCLHMPYVPFSTEIGRYVVSVLDSAAVNSLSPLTVMCMGALGVTQAQPGAKLRQSWSFSHPLM